MPTITGGCLCGALRWDYSGTVGPAAYCHCSDCRRITGSAFNISVPVEAAAFRIIKGTPRGFAKLSDAGVELTRYFCPDCGSPIFGSSPRHPETFYVKAGSFDDPGLIRPSHQSWTQSRVAWSSISTELPGFAKGRSY